MTELEQVEDRQRARYHVIKNVYDEAGDSITEGCDLSTAFEGAATDMEDGHGILEYLDEKGLLSDSTGGPYVALSHQGIVEIEESIMNPDAPTEHFKQGMVQYFYAAVGVVQNAQDSTAHVSQNNEGMSRMLNADQEKVRSRQERRWRVLKRIYDKSNGNVGNAVLWHKVQEEESLSDEEWWPVWDYLSAEGLMKETYSGAVSITHYGIERVEKIMRNPEAEKESYGRGGQSVQHFYAPVGAVQNAPQSTAYVTQHNTINSSEVLSLIEELRAKIETLPDNQEALEQIGDLEDEVKSQSPRKSRIKASLQYILSVTSDTGVSVLAEVISKAAGIS